MMFISVAALALLVLVILTANTSLPRLLAIVLFTVLLVRPLERLSGLPQISLLDDVLVALLLVRVIAVRIRGTQRGGFPGARLFAGFVVVGVLSGLLHQVPIGVLLAGTGLAMKGLVVGYCAVNCGVGVGELRSFSRWLVGLFVLVLISVAMNALAPASWASFFAANGGVIPRYGLPSLTGIFPHPFDLAFFAGIVSLTLIATEREKPVFLKVTIALLVVFFSFRRKELAGLILTQFVALGGRGGRTPSRTLYGLSVVAVVLLAAPFILAQVRLLSKAYLSVYSGEARTQLVLGSVRVARDYFPLGAGFGRYGSRTAAESYSPEYIRLGFPDLYGLGPGPQSGQFLTDTSWPAVLGETGVLGTALFVGGLAVLVRRVMLWRRESSDVDHRSFYTLVMCVVAFVLIESPGAAVFTSPPVYPFIFALAGVAASLHSREARNKESHVTAS